MRGHRILTTLLGVIAASFAQQALAAAPAGQWWYTNFDHRYVINIPAGASNLPTGYAVSLTFDHDALVNGGESLANGNDVRVVYWNGSGWTELDRVLDPESSWDSTTTKIWFETQAQINTGVTNDNYYLYYGDAAAGTPPQNATTVYTHLYDDFEDGAIGAVWSTNGTVTETGGILTVNGGARISNNSTFGVNTIWEASARVATASPTNQNNLLAANSTNNNNFGNYLRFRADNTANDYAQLSTGASTTFTATTPTAFQMYSFTREPAGAARFLHNGNVVATYASGADTGSLRMFLRNEANSAQTQQYEWVRVRPYRNPEPVLPPLGTAENLSTPLPVAEYRMEQASWTGAAGEALDSSGNSLNLTAFGGAATANATPAVAGDPGTCRYGNFDGTDNYLQVADNALFDQANQVSVTVWIYPRSRGTELKSIISKDTNYEFHLNASGQLYWWWGGGTQELTTAVTVPLNQWSHIAVTYQSGMQRIYINGVLRASGTATGTLATNNLPFQIGQDQGLADRFWNGLIDEVRVYGAALSAAQVSTIAGSTRPCSTVNHFAISHDGYGITCAATEPVRVEVHDSLHNSVTGYNQQITLDTQTGRGTWTLLEGTGTFADATANDGLATYVWPSGQSYARFALDYRSATPPGTTPPGTLAFNIDVYQSNNTALRDDDSDADMNFSPNGFTVTTSAVVNTSPISIPAFASPQTAGTAFNVYLTAYGQTPTDTTCGVIEGYTGAHALKFWPSYINPGTGTRGLIVAGVTSQTSEAAATSQSVAFSAGQAGPLTVQYRDVGLISIGVKDDTTGNPGLATGIRGGSNNFVVKPAGFVLSNIERTSDGFDNPAAGSASGTAFIAAGAAFSATVTAVDSGGNTTPNFGRESSPESARLQSNLVAPVAPPAVNNPAVTGTFGTFTSGVATGNAFSWPEVGIITLTPRLFDGDYLGAGDVIGTTSGNVGRFIPFNFGVTMSAASFTSACSPGNYIYLGQPMTYATGTVPVLSVTARALGGTTTQNYQGAFFKLASGSPNTHTYATSAGTLDQSALNTVGNPVAVPLNGGLGTLTFSTTSGLKFVRATPIAPFSPTLTLNATVLDSDGVAASTSTSVASTNPVSFGGIASPPQRYGRVAFRNAVGSELLNLPLTMYSEYFLGDTAGFTRNSDDSCTSGVTLGFSNFGGGLASGETCIVDSGSPGASTQGCSTAGAIGQRYSSPPSSGDFISILRAPGAANGGTVTVTATVPDWLRFDWDGTPATQENPSGIATFGIFQGPPRRIFQGEK